VQVVEYGLTSDEKLPFIVMEYLSGKTLKYYTDHPNELSPREKVEILRQIAEALAAIHAQGICHRDIKPHNILLSDEGRAKVMDFGIARLPDSELTMTSELLGSPAYLAPESFLSAHVDHRGDLFSMGILAYELLLGEKPFKGANLSNFAHLIQHERPIEPRKLQPGFPLRLQGLLARMLKKKRDERIASAVLVSQELETFLVEGDINASLVGSLTRAFAGDWR
jgi:serine/threonine protein kinase